MKHRLNLMLILAIFVFLSPFLSTTIQAGSLENTALRLDRQKANTATGGTVCAETPASANGTVAKVAVTFPSGFTVNSTESNWTVTTSNLPAGATAWPGIASATSVSGQTVTFPSSDLSASTYYCFNFSGSNTLTTGSAGDHQTGTIATLTSGGATIDYKTYAVSIGSGDQITVSATAPANPTDFIATLSVDPPETTVAQATTLKYTFTYGSNLSYASDLSIEAEWSLGTIDGASAPTVEPVDYLIGSASNAYGGAPAVVDLVSRKITWSISSFPGNSSRSVTFLLTTNSSYKGTNKVSFSVSGRVSGIEATTPDSTVTKNYLYNYVFTGTPTPGATSTPTPTPVDATEQTGTLFSGVNIRSLTDNTADILVTTESDSTLRVDYGKSPRSMIERINYLTPLKTHEVTFGDLDYDTSYYFRITASSGRQLEVSDIFSFRTASVSDTAKINFGSIVFFSNNNLFTFPGEDFSGGGKRPFIIIPAGTDYQFRFSLEGGETVRRIKGILRNLQVLGLATAYAEEDTTSIELLEVEPGIYLGSFTGFVPPGLYELYMQIFDRSGNIVEQKIADARIVEPFKILSKAGGQPIENAIVLLYWYNFDSKTYSQVPPAILGSKNPVNSLYDGTVPMTLSAGRYKADINVLGYKKTTVEFTIGPGKGETYPVVFLEPEPFNLMTLIAYYSGALYDVILSTISYVNNLSLSVRFFDLIAGVSLLLFAFTVIFSFSVRTHMRIRHMPAFFLYNLEDLLGQAKERYVYGELKDESGKHISRAKISLFDAKADKLLYITHTNKLGEFFMRKQKAHVYKLLIEKHGYNTLLVPDYLPNALTGKLDFTIQSEGASSRMSISKLAIGGLENLIGFTFEFLLLASVALEVIFLRTRGAAKTAPFILITVLTIIIWLFYAKRVMKRIFVRS